MNSQFPIWTIVVMLLLVVALTWFVWQYLKLKPLSEPILSLEAENHALKEKLKKNEEVFNTLNPVVERFIALRKGMSEIDTRLTAAERIQALHNLLEKAKLWDKGLTYDDGKTQLNSFFDEIEQALTIIQLLQQKIRVFYSDLRTYDLDEDAECKVRSDYLKLTTMMIDTLESVFNPNYSEDRQGINVKLLKEEITLDDAKAKAPPVTYLDIETPKWAQRFHKSIEKWAGTREQPLFDRSQFYLLNGYRFEFNS